MPESLELNIISKVYHLGRLSVPCVMRVKYFTVQLYLPHQIKQYGRIDVQNRIGLQPLLQREVLCKDLILQSDKYRGIRVPLYSGDILLRLGMYDLVFRFSSCII